MSVSIKKHEEERRRSALASDEIEAMAGDMLDAGCPYSYVDTFARLTREANQRGYERIFYLPCYATSNGLRKAVCIRCRVSREDLDGHLLVMLYAPSDDKEFAYVTFVCPGCSHEKYVAEVLALAVWAGEEMMARQ